MGSLKWSVKASCIVAAINSKCTIYINFMPHVAPFFQGISLTVNFLVEGETFIEPDQVYILYNDYLFSTGWDVIIECFGHRKFVLGKKKVHFLLPITFSTKPCLIFSNHFYHVSNGAN